MEKIKNTPEQKTIPKSLFGAAILAILASSCCILPLILVALGIGGAWMGNFSVFEPYRPLFILITLILLGVAFFKVYRKPKDDCGCVVGGFRPHRWFNDISLCYPINQWRYTQKFNRRSNKTDNSWS